MLYQPHQHTAVFQVYQVLRNVVAKGSNLLGHLKANCGKLLRMTVVIQLPSL
jgi:hypothetical protein